MLCEIGSTQSCILDSGCLGIQQCLDDRSWGSCETDASAIVCTPGQNNLCNPVFDGLICPALNGTQACNSCGTGFSLCEPAGSQVCCPFVEEGCYTQEGCLGQRLCSAGGAWGVCEPVRQCSAGENEACRPMLNGKICKDTFGIRSCDSCGQWSACLADARICPEEREQFDQQIVCEVDTDCNNYERCENKICIALTCPGGEVVNHSCFIPSERKETLTFFGEIQDIFSRFAQQPNETKITLISLIIFIIVLLGVFFAVLFRLKKSMLEE
jgi:hypothetical protein